MEHETIDEQPPRRLTAGRELREAREAEGMSRADVAAATKVAERHLQAIEEDRFKDLAARTYAIGFARAYARAVGLDEMAIAGKVRRQLDEGDGMPVRTYTPAFEPGDPARVPPARIAFIAALLAIVLLGVFALWRSSWFSPAGQLPSLVAPAPVASPATRASAAPARVAGPPSGPVTITATDEGVWLRVSDADKKTLVEKFMKQGETYQVPAGVKGPVLRTGRPDALSIAVGGRELPRLSDHPQVLSNVPLDPAGIVARTSGEPAAGASPGSAPAALSTAKP